MPSQHIVFTWDDGWFAPKAELNTWVSLCKAYGVGCLWAFPVVRATSAAPPARNRRGTIAS